MSGSAQCMSSSTRSVPDPPTDRSNRSTPSPRTTVGSTIESTGSSAGKPGRTRLSAARNGRSCADSSMVWSLTASMRAWATGRKGPPPSMARPISSTKPRRRANAAHSVTRRVLPIPASPVIIANPPVADSALSKRSAKRASSACRPTIGGREELMGGSLTNDARARLRLPSHRVLRTRPYRQPAAATLKDFRSFVRRNALGERIVTTCPEKHSCLPPEARGTSTFPERERPWAKQ